jgi:hypothetical protein
MTQEKRSRESEGKNTAAPIAPINDGDTRNENDLPAHEESDISFQGSTAEMGAMVAMGAKEESFIIEDDKTSFHAE